MMLPTSTPNPYHGHAWYPTARAPLARYDVRMNGRRPFQQY